MEIKTIKINANPIHNFDYCQVSNFDFCFSMLNEKNEVLYTPSPCKDYLQDIFWAENTGKKANVWGLTWKKGMLNIENVDFFSLSVFGGEVKISENAKGMISFINQFDKAQGFEPTTVYYTENDDIIVFKFSKEWTSSGPLLSAFTTLIRISGIYNEGEDIIGYLKNLMSEGKKKNHNYHNYMDVEVKRLSEGNTIMKLAALLNGKKIEYDWSHYKYTKEAHDTGIVYFSGFPVMNV